MPVRTRGRLRLDGLAAPLGYEVRAVNQDGVHVAFKLDETARAALQPLLRQATQRRAA